LRRKALRLRICRSFLLRRLGPRGLALRLGLAAAPTARWKCGSGVSSLCSTYPMSASKMLDWKPATSARQAA